MLTPTESPYIIQKHMSYIQVKMHLINLRKRTGFWNQKYGAQIPTSPHFISEMIGKGLPLSLHVLACVMACNVVTCLRKYKVHDT